MAPSLRKGSSSAATLTDSATSAASEGDLDAALQLLRQALQISPKYGPALVNLGNVLADQGDVQGASDAYERAMAVEPDNFECHANAGMLYSDMDGRKDDAILHLRAALRLDPKWGDGCYNLANLLSPSLEAVALYKRALAASPGDADTLINLSACLVEVGELDAAVAASAEAHRRHPTHAAAARQHASLLLQQSRHAEALRVAKACAAMEMRAAAATGRAGGAVGGAGGAGGGASSSSSPIHYETHALLAELLRHSEEQKASCLPHLQAASRGAPTAALKRTYAVRLYFALIELGQPAPARQLAAALAAQAKASGSAHDQLLLSALQGSGDGRGSSARGSGSDSSVGVGPTPGVQAAAACTAACAAACADAWRADAPGELSVLMLREGRVCGGAMRALTHKGRLASLLARSGLAHLAPTTALVRDRRELEAALKAAEEAEEVREEAEAAEAEEAEQAAEEAEAVVVGKDKERQDNEAAAAAAAAATDPADISDGAAAGGGSSGSGSPPRLWFLKQPGVQRGQGLTVFRADRPAEVAKAAAAAFAMSNEELTKGAAGTAGEAAEEGLVLQRSVAPPLLLGDGRRFALRVYVCLVRRAGGGAAATGTGTHGGVGVGVGGGAGDGVGQGVALTAWMLDEAIVLCAARPCTSEAEPLAHVCKPMWAETKAETKAEAAAEAKARAAAGTAARAAAGSGVALKGPTCDLWAEGWSGGGREAVRRLLSELMRAAAPELEPPAKPGSPASPASAPASPASASASPASHASPPSPPAAVQLLGVDVVVDVAGRPFLLECNAGPELSDTLRPGSRLRDTVGRRLACSLPELIAASTAEGGGVCEGWMRL